MSEMRTCPACAMEFDWGGVERDGETFCCAGCASGGECTCPQHHHMTGAPGTQMNQAAASQVGTGE